MLLYNMAERYMDVVMRANGAFRRVLIPEETIAVTMEKVYEAHQTPGEHDVKFSVEVGDNLVEADDLWVALWVDES